MCLYNLTSGRQAIREFTRAVLDEVGNLEPGKVYPECIDKLASTASLTDVTVLETSFRYQKAGCKGIVVRGQLCAI